MSSESKPEVLSAEAHYSAHLVARTEAHTRAETRADRLANVRLLLAGVSITVLVLPLFTRNGLIWWSLIPLTGVFIVLGKKQERLGTTTRQLASAIRFYQEGLDRLAERWRGLVDEGQDFVGAARASAHYADDLDLFGPASLFQLLNRAVTRAGRHRLAEWLTVPGSTETIGRRQAAVEELSEALLFREQLFSAASIESGFLDDTRFLGWAEAERSASSLFFLRVLSVVLPLFFFVSLVVYVFVDEVVPLLVAAGLILAALYGTRRFVAERIALLSGPEALLGPLARFLALIEKSTLQGEEAQRLKETLKSQGRGAVVHIGALQRLIDLLDARLNALFSVSIGAALLWNLNLVLRAERWRAAHGHRLRGWFEVIGEMEAIASLAAFRWERPDYSFATFSEGAARFDAEGLAHPLIRRDEVVANDLSLGGQGAVLLLSGSNMSGKSTLLRSIGINWVLAHAGAPVAARVLTLSRIRLATSIRIVDSLASGTSHFFEEIKRIKFVLDASNEGEGTLLYLLDEVLHGTNSRERYLGALAVIRFLSDRGAMGVVTTHDLALSKLEESLQDKLTHQHFSDDVQDGKIRFGYQLQPGPIASTNALRLMRSIGIDLDFEAASSGA